MNNQLRIASAFAMVLLIAVGNAWAQGVRHAEISEARGEVEIRKEGGVWEPAQGGILLYEQDEIRTAPGGFAEILLDQGASTGKLELKEKSHLKLTTLDWDSQLGEKVTLLDLAIGRVLVHAEKLRGNSRFEVRTPTATTGVRGTIFEVSVEEA